MAYYTKIGLLILNEDHSKFLITEAFGHNKKPYWLIPGGRLTNETEVECLQRQMHEELQCELDTISLKYIGEYIDQAAGWDDRDVSINLFQGSIIGTPIPSTEVTAIRWIGKDDLGDERLSAIIKNKIIPDLIKRKILL